MRILVAITGISLLAAVLWDAFETIVLPRRVTRRVRLARLFYRYTWLLYSTVGSAIWSRKRQDAYLSYFGPLSLLALVGLWAFGLVVGFALLQWANGSSISDPQKPADFLSNLYLSGTTFFTLGLGDVTPQNATSRALVVIEAGTGFAFLAVIIGYLPSLNQAFSRREVSISLLDARAGSPPTAGQMLLRHGDSYGMEALQQLLHEWERWSAEFLEIHLSYPVLAYFRSQHDNQSWLAALTAILDASALTIMGIEGAGRRQAKRTFANARHAVVDLALVFGTPPMHPSRDRLSSSELAILRAMLAEQRIVLDEDNGAEERLLELRNMYEPYVYSLSRYFRISIPPWFFGSGRKDNWQMSVWPTLRSRSHEPEPRHFQ